jgi:hypothetical protein
MRSRLLSAVACLALSLLNACGTVNAGGLRGPAFAPRITSFVLSPWVGTSFESRATASISLAWTGGTAPFDVVVDLGGAAPNPPAGRGILSPYDYSVALQDFPLAKDCMVRATVTDASGRTTSESFSITVLPAE